MSRIQIPHSEFTARLERIQAAMAERRLELLIVYGDEYRKENLRYVCNFWPIFERAACFIPRRGLPVLAGAPEGAVYAREMCVWPDIRNVKEFACVTVPEEIDYPLATFSSFREIIADTAPRGGKIALVGWWDMPAPILERIKAAAATEIVDGSDILTELRLIKTPAEIACLREAGRQACIGYRELMDKAVPGNTENFAIGAAEGAARMAGAEAINFSILGSGRRARTIIGRPTSKVIRDGEMIMAALAVQYQGYVATVEYPFVAGKASERQKAFLRILIEAAETQQRFLRPGVVCGEMVRQVKAVFAKHNMSRFDIYPPMHGIGLAEAESPYPDENTQYAFRAGMCVNSDISLWGYRYGSNRIEEGFVITEKGAESLTPMIRKLLAKGI